MISGKNVLHMFETAQLCLSCYSAAHAVMMLSVPAPVAHISHWHTVPRCFCPTTDATFQDGINALVFCRGMYVLLFLQFASSTFYDPARRALEPMLVPKKQLHLATTLDTFAWSVTVALGSSLGGAVVSKLGTTMCFLLDSCTFVCAAVCVLILQVKSWQRDQHCSMCSLCTLQTVHAPDASIASQTRGLRHMSGT